MCQAPAKAMMSRDQLWRRFARRGLSYAPTSLHPFAPPALPGFVAIMGALTPGRSALRILIRDNELRPYLRPGLPVLRHQTFRPFRLQPPVVASRFRSGFDLELTAWSGRPHPFLGTRASLGLHRWQRAGHDNRPNRVCHPTDQSFTSSCSPPLLTETQLLSVTEFRPILTGTSTPPVRCAYRRTATAGLQAVHEQRLRVCEFNRY